MLVRGIGPDQRHQLLVGHVMKISVIYALRVFMTLTLANAWALSSAAGEAPPAPQDRVHVKVTGTCGDAGFVGEVTDNATTLQFKSCVEGGIARASFFASDGQVLAEYDMTVVGSTPNKYRIRGIEWDPESDDLSPVVSERLVELLKHPSAPMMASVPDRLLDLGFCAERPALAAMLGLAFLVGGGE